MAALLSIWILFYPDITLESVTRSPDRIIDDRALLDQAHFNTTILLIQPICASESFGHIFTVPGSADKRPSFWSRKLPSLFLSGA